MSGIAVLIGLLVVAFLGSVLASERSTRGFSSGAGYLVVGFVLGPQALALFERSLVSEFEPIFVVGVSWIALVAGVSYFRGSGRRLPLGRAAVGTLGALLVAAAAAGAAYPVLRHLSHLSRFECIVLSIAAAAALAEAGHHVAVGVGARVGARWPVQEMVTELGQASAVVPIALVVVLFALASSGHAEPPAATTLLPEHLLGAGTHQLARLSFPVRCLIAPGIGLVLGITAALLLGREFRRDESWGILLGTSLLGVGASERLGVSAIGMAFVMGLVLSASRHGAEIQSMVAPTEKPVFLPVALLAGLYVAIKLPLPLLLAAGAVLLAKLIVRPLAGVLFAVEPAARPAVFELGGSLLASGSLTLAIGLSARIGFPGAFGDSVLLIACVSAILGELVAPTLLRRALASVGEIDVAESRKPEANGAQTPDIPPPPRALSEESSS